MINDYQIDFIISALFMIVAALYKDEGVLGLVWSVVSAGWMIGGLIGAIVSLYQKMHGG